MRKFIAGIAFSVVGVSVAGVAHAETWQSRMALIADRSLPSCGENQISWAFTLEGNQLSGKSSAGATFATTAAADGAVKVQYQGSTGRDQYPVELTGNVRTKKFEFYNIRASCRWRTTSH